MSGRPALADGLVVGDRVMLGEGDRICADARLDEVHALAIDSSTLTGESVPHHPQAGEPAHAGCLVPEGEAGATVVATGAATPPAGVQRSEAVARESERHVERNSEKASESNEVDDTTRGTLLMYC